MFTFGLFLALGLAVFVPLQGNVRTVVMIVYVVMLAIWLLLGFDIVPNGGRFR